MLQHSWPERIGPYTIERLLGKGSMATVFLGRTKHGQPVAVKWLNEDHLPWVRRFYRESAILKKVSHPNIVRFLGGGIYARRPFIVMQYVEGLNLRAYTNTLQEKSPMERYNRCRSIGKEIAMALAHLHQLGIIHRDVKPSNILIDQYERAILTDFGTIKELHSPDSEDENIIIGTPAFAAPEQIFKQAVSPQTDQYGLGATLYYIVTQQRPFHGLKREQPPVPPSHFDPNLPEDIEQTILKLMSPPPAERYTNTLTICQVLSQNKNEGLPLAGRQEVLEQISQQLQLVSEGSLLIVRPIGLLMSNWAIDTLIYGAKRRNITIVELKDELDATHVEATLEEGKAMLIIDHYGIQAPAYALTANLQIFPLRLADVQRSIIAKAHKTKEVAVLSEYLFTLTGGIPSLLLTLLERFTIRGVFELPDNLPLLPEIDLFLTQLTPKQLRLLAFICAHKAVVSTEEIQKTIKSNPRKNLLYFKNQGIIEEKTKKHWVLIAEIFRSETLRRIQQLGKNIPTSPSSPETCSPEELRKNCEQIHILSARGMLFAAKQKAEYNLLLTRSHVQRTLFCNTQLALGQVLLDIGLFDESSKIFADVKSLATAHQLHAQQHHSIAFLARTVLEKQSGSRSGASIAINQLSAIITRSKVAFVWSVWAWALATLGDIRRWKKNLQRVELMLPQEPPITRLRSLFCLLRGACAIADYQTANRLIAMAEPWLADYTLLRWELQRVQALLGTQPPPDTTPLLNNLSTFERKALKNRWIFARGISPDPTWND